MKGYFFAMAFFVALAAMTYARPDTLAERLRRFEVNWLTADLNGDARWQQRFLAGKLAVIAEDSDAPNDRRSEVARLLSSTLPTNETKVRITGTISLLTSDPAQNRSFNFLDTFNKKGDRWQVIATSMSPSPEVALTDFNRGPIEQELIRLEKVSVQVVGANDRKILGSMTAADFIGTSITGQVRDRNGWIREREHEGYSSERKANLVVNVYSETLAVVTGINATSQMKSGKEITRENRFTDTWLKRDGKWQMIATQLTELK